MSQKQDSPSPVQQWEQTLIDDYRSYRWHQVMEPLCDKMQLWKAGQVPLGELDRFMEDIHRQICEVRSMFSQRRDRLVNLIQWWDREWFLEWIKEYSPPPGASVLPHPPEPADES